MNTRIKICGLLLLVSLTACGKVGPLTPAAGQKPPATAYGSNAPAGSDALVTASEQARPGRSDELMRRSERRTDDPFDVPPGSEPKPVDEAIKTPQAEPIMAEPANPE
jgi:predicted small lipoprotein YifL